jgi:O-antigen ligase
MWSAEIAGTRFMLQSLAIALVFLFAFAALLNTEAELRRLLYVFAFSSAFMGGLSVLAFGGAFGQEGDSIPYLQLLQAGRGQGGVGDPDFFAGIQLVALPLILVLASDAKDKRMRIALYASVLVVLASVFTSLSRGSYLAFIVLAIGLIASRPEKVFRSRREKAAALLVLALGMVVFFSRPFVREEVVGRAQSIYAPQTRDEKSGAGRTNLWKAAMRTAGEHPVTGVGFGTFPHISQELIFHTPGIDLEVLQIREEGNNFVAHNTYVGTAAELGFVGLFLYLGVILSTGLMLKRLSNRALALGSDFVGRVAHALLIGLSTWAIVIVFLSGETARMFWIIVGISLALPKLLPEPAPALGEGDEVAWSPPRPVLRAAPVRVAAAGAAGLLAPPPSVTTPRLLAPGERPLPPPAPEPPAPVAAPSPQRRFEPAVEPPVVWMPPTVDWEPPPELPARVHEPPPERIAAQPRRLRPGDRLVQLGAAAGLLYALGLLALVLLR